MVWYVYRVVTSRYVLCKTYENPDKIYTAKNHLKGTLEKCKQAFSPPIVLLQYSLLGVFFFCLYKDKGLMIYFEGGKNFLKSKSTLRASC